MKKNIPGLWLLLLDVAVALAGFCTGVHFFWKDQNEGGVVVAAAMSAALAVVPGEVFGPMLGRDKSKKFEVCIFLTSMLMSWDAGAAMACANYGGKGTPFSGMGMALWLLSLGLVYCDYAYCGFVLKHANPSSMHLMLAPIPFFVGMGLPGFLYGSVKPTLTYERGALIREEVQTFSLWPLLLNGYRYSKARGVHVQHQCSGCGS